VRVTRLLLGTVLGAAVAMAGCAATSHLGALQSASAADLAQAGPPPAPHKVARPSRQLGIDVDFYDYQGLSVAAAARADVAYVKKLHGNAMSVSFPFFMDGARADSVHATAATPSPAQLAIVADYAEHAGLYFSIRPLLDESSLDYPGGRTKWTPTDQAKWFASYERFLRPYAVMASQQDIPELITGVEFDQFNNSPYWARLDAYLRTYYRGSLAYSDNWEIPIPSRVNSSGVLQLVDAYKPMQVADDATVATLTRAWEAYLGSDARGIVLSELGIAAQDGAYGKPFDFAPDHKPLVPEIQSRWFTAACDAVAARPDAGLYFWSITIGQQFNVPPGPADPASFVDGPGAGAISACFKRMG
jgi:hypothetical protein